MKGGACMLEATLECVTFTDDNTTMNCHTDCGPFWADDDDD